MDKKQNIPEYIVKKATKAYVKGKGSDIVNKNIEAGISSLIALAKVCTNSKEYNQMFTAVLNTPQIATRNLEEVGESKIPLIFNENDVKELILITKHVHALLGKYYPSESSIKNILTSSKNRVDKLTRKQLVNGIIGAILVECLEKLVNILVLLRSESILAYNTQNKKNN